MPIMENLAPCTASKRDKYEIKVVCIYQVGSKTNDAPYIGNERSNEPLSFLIETLAAFINTRNSNFLHNNYNLFSNSKTNC